MKKKEIIAVVRSLQGNVSILQDIICGIQERLDAQQKLIKSLALGNEETKEYRSPIIKNDTARWLIDELRNEEVSNEEENETKGASKIAKRDYRVGEVVEYVNMWSNDVSVSHKPSKYTVFFDDETHIDYPLFKYINHSCNANTVPFSYIGKNDTIFTFIAIKPIKKGDEITFNYLHNEKEIANPFDCLCGSHNCVGRVCTENRQ